MYMTLLMIFAKFIRVFLNPHFLHRLYMSLFLNTQNHLFYYADNMVRGTLQNRSNAHTLLYDAPITSMMEIKCHKRYICI